MRLTACGTPLTELSYRLSFDLFDSVMHRGPNVTPKGKPRLGGNKRRITGWLTRVGNAKGGVLHPNSSWIWYQLRICGAV